MTAAPPPPPLNLRHIEVFESVYRHGTVSGAARALGIAQPTATQILGHAESLLGFALFRRERGRLVATEDAHRLFAQAERIREQVDLFRMMGRNLRAGRGTRLSVSSIPVLALELVPAAVARFLRERPDCFFDLHSFHHDEVARRLAAGDAEVVLGFAAPAAAAITVRVLGHGRLGLLTLPGTPGDGPARLEDIAGRKLVSVAQSGPLGDRIAAAIAERAITVDEVASARTFHLAAALVRAGAGMAIVDSFTAASPLAAGLAFAPIEPEVTFDVVALHASTRPPSRQMTAFLDTVAALLASDRPWL